MFILDTDVVSALRRPDRAPQVAAWARANIQSPVAISAITVGEIEMGITQQETRNPGFAVDLKTWFAVVLTQYAQDILPLTAEDARIWGRLSAQIGHKSPDLMIAAQALRRQATVVTRNVTHFAPTGAQVLNPFDA